MQRRAATVYGVLFLVIAAGAYSLIGVAQQPQIDVQGDTYAENETVTVNGLTYNVSSIGDGEATLTRLNESARYTATWQNNSTVELEDNSTYRVLIPNESDPGQFTLRQEFELGENVSTVEQDGTQYVVVNQSDGNRSLVPVDEYQRQQFGEPDTRQHAEGDTFQLRGNETTVTNVTAGQATVAWNAPRTIETSFSEGENVTLGPADDGQTFAAHFVERNVDGNATTVVQLSPDPNAYHQQVGEINHFNERISGLWGVAILSAITVVLLFGLAFLPNK
jgi:hypothetical protein